MVLSPVDKLQVLLGDFVQVSVCLGKPAQTQDAALTFFLERLSVYPSITMIT